MEHQEMIEVLTKLYAKAYGQDSFTHEEVEALDQAITLAKRVADVEGIKNRLPKSIRQKGHKEILIPEFIANITATAVSQYLIKG